MSVVPSGEQNNRPPHPCLGSTAIIVRPARHLRYNHACFWEAAKAERGGCCCHKSILSISVTLLRRQGCVLETCIALLLYWLSVTLLQQPGWVTLVTLCLRNQVPLKRCTFHVCCPVW